MSWSKRSFLAATGLHVAIRTERSHQSSEVCIWLKYRWGLGEYTWFAIYGITSPGFMQHFILNGPLEVDKPRNCFLSGKVFYSAVWVQQIGNYNSL